jgi:hypothetical protein
MRLVSEDDMVTRSSVEDLLAFSKTVQQLDIIAQSKAVIRTVDRNSVIDLLPIGK